MCALINDFFETQFLYVVGFIEKLIITTKAQKRKLNKFWKKIKNVDSINSEENRSKGVVLDISIASIVSKKICEKRKKNMEKFK